MQLLDTALWLGNRVRAGALLLPHLHEMHRGAHHSAATLVERNAREHPGETALLYEDRAYSWAEVNGHGNRWARLLLAEGVVRGDVVALAMDNRPEYVFCLVGVSKIRAIVECLHTALAGEPLPAVVRSGNT